MLIKLEVKMDSELKLKPNEFKATINSLNQITVDSEVRKKYGLKFSDKIIVEIKGKYSIDETKMKLEEVKEE